MTTVEAGNMLYEPSEHKGRPAILVRKRVGRGSRLFAPGTLLHTETRIFSTAEARDKALVDQAAAWARWQERKAEAKAARHEPHAYKVGDIFVSTWGYDQTNVDWYVVTETTKHTVKLAPIAGKMLEPKPGYSPMSGFTVPEEPVRITGEAKRHRAYGNAGISLTSYSTARKWEGGEVYMSWYA